MATFLIIRLQGVMQAWGKHTYEDMRLTEIFPTRSGLIGLLGACLGISRDKHQQLQDLGHSFRYAVRIDQREIRNRPLSTRKIRDFHTVLDTRKVNGSVNENPVISHREYLCDAHFSVVLETLEGAVYPQAQIADALQKPFYTPYLGRRSCPITAPLYGGICEAEDLISALSKIAPYNGMVYSEQEIEGAALLKVRDVPRHHENRQFDTRSVYLYIQEDKRVSQSV